MSAQRHWTSVCALADILPGTGVCARVERQQVAIFLVGDATHAIGNYDPGSGANVLSRGIVGDQGGEIVVASPIYKQHYSLITGQCLEEADLRVSVYPTRIVAGDVWVRNQPLSLQRRPGKRRLVVVGSGVAAMRVIEGLLERTPHSYDITVFGAEAHSAYNRVLLTPLLAGDKRLEDVVTHPPEWFEQAGIVFHRGDRVVRIDRLRRVVHSECGVQQPYDRLVLATGSTAVVLPVPGRELNGVVTFRDLADVDTMLRATTQFKRATVIGGGVLGLEAASALQRRGMQVTVIHHGGLLMNRQLDAAAAELLKSALSAQGLRFQMNATVSAFLGEDRVTGVRLTDGTEQATDLVVLAVGTQPNTTLANQAGLRCDRGILVDDTLQTFDPAIYAVGECVQHRDSTYGLVAPLSEQANVCAAHLAEQGRVRYLGSTVFTQLKVAGLEVFSTGNYQGGEGTEALVLRDLKRGVYKRLVLKNNRVTGAVLYGDTADGQWYFDLIREGRDITPLRDRLMFGASACSTVPSSAVQ